MCLLKVLVGISLFSYISYFSELVVCMCICMMHAQWVNRPVVDIYTEQLTRDIAPCPTNSSCINMPSVRIFTARIPCYTFSAAIATNWIISFELWAVNGARCHFLKDNICQRADLRVEQNDGLSWEKGKRDLCGWIRSQYFWAVHGLQMRGSSLLPRSFVSVFQFRSDWRQFFALLAVWD